MERIKFEDFYVYSDRGAIPLNYLCKKKFCIQAFSSGSKYMCIKGLISDELFLGMEQNSVYRQNSS